jgi:hypothetical protein
MKRLSEVIRGVEQFDTDEQRAAYLRNLEARYQKPVRVVLEYMFDKRRKFLLPEGSPPYKKCEFDEPGMMFMELRRLYLFVEGGNPNLRQNRREAIFTQILEAVCQPDAELLLAIKDKKSPYRGLNKKVARMAFPELDIQ